MLRYRTLPCFLEFFRTYTILVSFDTSFVYEMWVKPAATCFTWTYTYGLAGVKEK